MYARVINKRNDRNTILKILNLAKLIHKSACILKFLLAFSRKVLFIISLVKPHSILYVSMTLIDPPLNSKYIFENKLYMIDIDINTLVHIKNLIFVTILI